VTAANVEMTHEQAADEIEAVALGIASDEVVQGVTAHAARCDECAAELRSFYDVVTALAGQIPARQLNRGHSAGIKSRLFAKATAGKESSPLRRSPMVEQMRAPEPRAAASAAARPVEHRAPEPRPVARAARVDDAPVPPRDRDRSSMPMWIAILATVIALGSIAAWLNARGDQPPAAVATADDAPEDVSRLAELERLVSEKDTVIASLSGPGVRIIGLFNREAREPLARMFWDRRNERWTLFVYSLRQPRQGKTFHVWLGTDSGPVSLGNFQPESDGTATFRAVHSVAIAELNTVSISEEDAGGRPAAPTGPVVLAGALR
jgi:hypothetical protein